MEDSEPLVLIGPGSGEAAAAARADRFDDTALSGSPASAHAALGEEAIAVLAAVVLAVALWVGAGAAGAQARDQGAVALRDTVLQTAMQCFAIEGAYPQTLAYLEDNYGLTVNHDAYAVTYEAFASNMMPSVVVTLK